MRGPVWLSRKARDDILIRDADGRHLELEFPGFGERPAPAPEDRRAISQYENYSLESQYAHHPGGVGRLLILIRRLLQRRIYRHPASCFSDASH